MRLSISHGFRDIANGKTHVTWNDLEALLKVINIATDG